MKRLGQGLAVLAVLFAPGCQSRTSDSPLSPAPPPPPGTPPPTAPEVQLIPFGFGGPLFQPDTILRIAPGTRLVIPVMTSFSSLNSVGRGASVLVRTDAPQTVLSVSSSVSVVGSGEPGLVEVHALDSASSGEPPDTYRVWLEEDPAELWPEGWGPGVDERPLHLAVLEAPPPPPPCETLELRARVGARRRDGGTRARLTFGPLADDFRSGTITLRTDHPETSLSLLSQYRMPYEDLDPESDRARVRYHVYPTTFAFGLGFRETGGGFEQTMTLGWFDELQLRAEAPECDPVDLHCDESGRCTLGGQSP